MKKIRSGAQRQAGATIIEFSLVLIVFLTFFLGILDLSRMLFSWGAANEATRAGARYAVVCDDTTCGERRHRPVPVSTTEATAADRPQPFAPAPRSMRA